MTKISVSVTPKEHRFLTLAAKGWARKTRQRIYGKGPLAAYIRWRLLAEENGGALRCWK